jgi:hypothetical protein
MHRNRVDEFVCAFETQGADSGERRLLAVLIWGFALEVPALTSATQSTREGLLIRIRLQGRTRWLSMMLATITVSVVGLIGTGPASAYNLEGGYKWNGGPAPGNCCAYIHVSYWSGMAAIDSQGWTNGIGAWNASPAPVILDQHAGNLAVHDLTDPNTSNDGYTNWWETDGHFTSTLSYLNYYYTNGYAQWQVQAVATHELGHAIGLDPMPLSLV